MESLEPSPRRSLAKGKLIQTHIIYPLTQPCNSMKVVIGDVNLEGAQEAAHEFDKQGKSAWAVQVDVADWESQKQAFEVAAAKLSRVDYVFPIAGITERPWNAKQPSGSGFVKPNLSVLDVNATGVLYTCSLAIQQFRSQQPDKHGFRGKSESFVTYEEPK